MSRLFRNICVFLLHGIACLPAYLSGQTYASLVQFKSFDASVLQKNTIELAWEITGEPSAGIYFIIERSSDGRAFRPLHQAVIEPQPDKGRYRFIDHFTLLDSAYYRVVIFGETAQTLVSAIQKVKGSAKPQAEVMIMPNPVFNNAALIINDESLGDITCILYDMTGKKIRTYQIRKTTAYLQQILDMYSVPKGEYVLSIQSSSLYESKRILKQ